MTDETKDITATEATVTFSLPDVITLDVWDSYEAGRKAYRERQARNGKPATEVPNARYFGALKVIDDGLVHVLNAPEALDRWIHTKVEDQGKVPLSILWFVVTEVALPIETAFFEILPWEKKAISPNGSSPTS